MTLAQLKRLRWGVRFVLSLGVAASVTANVLHAEPNLVSQVISAWSPLALLAAIELISRVPILRRSLALLRWAATGIIAGIAAWVSYWHMVAVAAEYGESGAAPYLLPFSVDGLVVVASVCLVEIGGRMRARLSADQAPAEVYIDDVELDDLLDDLEPDPSGEPEPEPAADQPSSDPGDQSRRPTTGRTRARSLTAADRVLAAHRKHPYATHERIAELTGLSLTTVKKYRPRKASATGQPSAQPPAETPANGQTPDLAEVPQ